MNETQNKNTHIHTKYALTHKLGNEGTNYEELIYIVFEN